MICYACLVPPPRPVICPARMLVRNGRRSSLPAAGRVSGERSAGGAQAGGDGIDREQQVGEQGFGVCGAVGLVARSPFPQQRDLAVVEDTQWGFPNGEGFGHARTAYGQRLAEELGQMRTGALEFGDDEIEEAFSKLRVPDEAGIVAHQVKVGGREVCFHIGEDIG